MISILAPSLALPTRTLQTGASFGERLPLWSLAPFVLLLIAIALMPLVAGRWWHSNRNRALLPAIVALPFAVWLYSAFGAESIEHLQHAGADYVSFLTLLGALYVVSGGIGLLETAATNAFVNPINVVSRELVSA